MNAFDHVSNRIDDIYKVTYYFFNLLILISGRFNY